ncbi:hypothetical protein [Burkholderia cepacia]|uniref:hypothetical protein n=1 Tax=Burkholderia cepacia TaxID=292 RepID=UPI0029902708|nr:hypothetical protein [Burkholderia cepacia]
MRKVLYSQLTAPQLEKAFHKFPEVRPDQQFRYLVADDGNVIGREPITGRGEENVNEGSASEKLVRIEADGIATYVRPSAVQAIKPRLLGSDVYLAPSGGHNAEKVFIALEADEIAILLGLV